MILPGTIDFLEELKRNNYKEWFHENKATYQKAKKNIEDFINKIILEFGKVDESILSLNPKDCMFRINRDIRFSNDKSPYKTNFGIYFSKGGKKSKYSGYYVHIEPDGFFVGGGLYHPPTPTLKLIRNEIYFNLDKFLTIVENNEFKNEFGGIQGEKLTNPPKGYPKEFEGIEWLKFKSYTVMKNVNRNSILSGNFADEVIRLFTLMKPIVQFLNEGIDNEE